MRQRTRIFALDTLIIHAGLPKTGSSALQVALARNRQTLLARGLDYLEIGDVAQARAGEITGGNGGLLGRVLVPEGHRSHRADPRGKILGQFLGALERSPAATGIISSELFSVMPAESLDRLVAITRDAGIRPVCVLYLRRQDGAIASVYAQAVKRQACTRYPEDYIEILLAQLSGNGGQYDYDQVVARMDRIFGPDNVMARLYEPTARLPGLIFEDFLAAVTGKAEMDGLDPGTGPVNTSLSPVEQKFMLWLNRFKPPVILSDGLVEYSIRHGHSAAHGGNNILSPDLRRRIVARFADSNRRLARARFGREDLFDPVEDRPHTDLRQVRVGVMGGLTMLAWLAVYYPMRQWRRYRHGRRMARELSRNGG